MGARTDPPHFWRSRIDGEVEAVVVVYATVYPDDDVVADSCAAVDCADVVPVIVWGEVEVGEYVTLPWVTEWLDFFIFKKRIWQIYHMMLRRISC